MKREIWVPLLVLFLGLAAAALWYFKPAGTIEGPEWDILHVDGVTYVSEKSSAMDIPYNRSDRGRHLGIIRSGKNTFHIYEVKGDPERNYLYWAWDWEGEMFVRKEIADAAREQNRSGTEKGRIE